MSEITIAEHAGFCYGVTRAVNTAYTELERAKADGRTLYCLGSLIHNRLVTDELEALGLKTVSCIDEIPDGSRVLIRAHGEPDSTYEKGRDKNMEFIDATCPRVASIHKIAREADR